MRNKIFCLVILVVIFASGQAFALSNGEIVAGRQSIFYNINLMDEIRAICIEGESGFTSTLAANGRYIYAASNSYFDLYLKFKLYDTCDLKIAGRLGINSDFQKETPLHKTLGFVFSKAHNSFLTLNGGCDYSMDTGEIGFFAGLDYQLASRAYFQVGYQKFISRSDTQGFVLGLRTDL